jgi:hypothetical protein
MLAQILVVEVVGALTITEPIKAVKVGLELLSLDTPFKNHQHMEHSLIQHHRQHSCRILATPKGVIGLEMAQ